MNSCISLCCNIVKPVWRDNWYERPPILKILHFNVGELLTRARPPVLRVTPVYNRNGPQKDRPR